MLLVVAVERADELGDGLALADALLPAVELAEGEPDCLLEALEVDVVEPLVEDVAEADGLVEDVAEAEAFEKGVAGLLELEAFVDGLTDGEAEVSTGLGAPGGAAGAGC